MPATQTLTDATRGYASDRHPAALWVFGYGSLMWNPGFPYAERRAARLTGYHRAFCIYSTHHRGSHEKPGLVLGLDRGGSCQGTAFRIAEADRPAVLAYLRQREQVSGVYREASVLIGLAPPAPDSPAAAPLATPLTAPAPLSASLAPTPAPTPAPATVRGTAFVVEPRHPSYTGPMSVFERARLIRAARGSSGPNVEYLVQTWHQLVEAGIADAHIERVITAVGGLFASRRGAQIKAASAVLIAAKRHEPPFAPLMRRHARRRFMHRLKLDALKG